MTLALDAEMGGFPAEQHLFLIGRQAREAIESAHLLPQLNLCVNGIGAALQQLAQPGHDDVAGRKAQVRNVPNDEPAPLAPEDFQHALEHLLI